MPPKTTSSSEPSSTLSSPRKPPTTAPSSPPSADSPQALDMTLCDEDNALLQEEQKAARENQAIEAKAKAAAARKRKSRAPETAEGRRKKAQQLQGILEATMRFSGILMNKSSILGRVGTALDGKSLAPGEGDKEDIKLEPQPRMLTGGILRDYQLEGLTWMWEIFCQGMSGILADEMGTGKTIQTISLIARIRKENCFGPFLVIVPMSTLPNWMGEFRRWAPSIPVVKYHGSPDRRADMRRTKLHGNFTTLSSGGHKFRRPNERFPVVLTTYEIIMRDRNYLQKIDWDLVVIDEGHRMKNAEAKLFACLKTFKSNVRFLLTGTPLQNNLKELWSLLNFLLPDIFADWDAFESWFNFEDLADEDRVDDFIDDDTNRDLVQKMHIILRPLMLRRLKSDVLKLPPKREYVLFAPLVPEQAELYNVISDPKRSSRDYLERKVAQRLLSHTNSPVSSTVPSIQSSRSSSVPRKSSPGAATTSATFPSPNAFAMMMANKKAGISGCKNASLIQEASKAKIPIRGIKRKQSVAPVEDASKSIKSSRESTPSLSKRGRLLKKKSGYQDSDASDDDALDDDEFEAKLEKKLAEADRGAEVHQDEGSRALEAAKNELRGKKLGNPIVQLRLVANSVHNFYDPFIDPADVTKRLAVDETIVNSSGKMLLLDRLLPRLIKDGHRVLIFSQFKTQLDILVDYCSELRGWDCMRIDGAVAAEERQELIDEFNCDAKYKVFLLSTRAGGQGLNLAGADTVILFDSDWNPQQDLQAQDRCHRIGQTRPVIVYRIVTKNTVEEQLITSAGAKRRLEKLVIKKGNLWSMMQGESDVDQEALKALKLKDGEVFRISDRRQILTDGDLAVLCDRSEAAYDKAASGQGNSTAFTVVETKDNRISAPGGPAGAAEPTEHVYDGASG